MSFPETLPESGNYHENSEFGVDHLGDETDMDYYSELDSEYDILAEQHWEESVKQIQGLVSLVLFPLIGKLLGRRTAHTIWRHFADWYFP